MQFQEQIEMQRSGIYCWTNESAVLVHRAGTSFRKLGFLPFPGSQACDVTSPKCRGPGSKVNIYIYYFFAFLHSCILGNYGIHCT